jgi:dTDP-4-dehydrorhamnose 3,5-epimerase
MFKIKTKFKDLYIHKKKYFYDNRGLVYENLSSKFSKIQYKVDIVSYSKFNVLRGLHFQTNSQQSKFLSVLSGKILDICVDLRKNSKTFGKFYKIILSKKNQKSIFIPKGFAHGFCVLSQNTIVYYKASHLRNPKEEHCIKWNDRELNISWPKKKFILSKKDKNGMSFDKFKKIIKYL